MKKRRLKGYMCGTAPMDLNLGAIYVKVYSSIKVLKEENKCWKECGIVEIEIEPKIKLKSNLRNIKK